MACLEIGMFLRRLKKIKNHKFILALFIFSVIYTGVFFHLRLMQHKSFFSFEWEDDARENQVVYNTAVSFYPHQTIVNSSYFSDHFTLIYFLVALPYKVYPHIYTWYFLISLSYGFSSLIVYSLAKNIIESKTVAFVISLSYLLYSPLHYINLGALDANQFSLPLLFLTFYFLYKRKFIPYLIFMILSCLCKEDIPPVIFLFGIYQLLMKYPRKWWAVTIVFSVCYFTFASYTANTFFRVVGFNSHGKNFDYLDWDTVRQILEFIFISKMEALEYIFNWLKLKTIIMVFSPLIFIPLFSFEIFIPLTMYAEVLLSNHYFLNYNSYLFSPLIPFLFISLLFSLRRISVRLGKRGILCISFLIFLLCFLSNFGRNIPGCVAIEREDIGDICDARFMAVKNIFDRRFYTVDEEDRIAWKFIGMIPKGASVAASGDLLPALSSRKVLYEFGLNNPKTTNSESFKAYPAYNADYILIHKKCLYNGLGGHYASFRKEEDLRGEINNFINNYNFTLLKEEGNFILLRKALLQNQQ